MEEERSSAEIQENEEKMLNEKFIYTPDMAYYDSISSNLRTIKLQELLDYTFDGGIPVIENILYSGLYVFAGAPKVGKSFLMAQFAYHVSTGTDLWEHKVNKGKVLYLALEDNFSRLQNRIFKMYGSVNESDLYFCTVSAKLDSGLLTQLDNFINENAGTKLIIIDTLQKVREPKENNFSYGDDYKVMGELKKFADEHHVCLMVVHHTRKLPATDKFEMISGTTGIMGCADGAFIMSKDDRSEGFAELLVSGRDQPDMKLRLVRNCKTLRWELDNEESDIFTEEKDPLIELIKGLLEREQKLWEGTPTELVNELGIDLHPNQITRKLNVLNSRLENECYIKYQYFRRANERIIRLVDCTELVKSKADDSNDSNDSSFTHPPCCHQEGK